MSMQTDRRADSERASRRIASENAASCQSGGRGRRLIWHPGRCHARGAGPWTRSVIQFAIGALTVMATDCNEQSVISSLQSAQTEYLRHAC
jgi:hypothetical protein